MDCVDYSFPVFFKRISKNIAKKKKDANARATAEAFLAWVNRWANVSALFLEDPEVFLKEIDQILIKEKGLDTKEIEALITQRNEAREAKDWAKSDEARDKLVELGIEIHDGPQGTSWEGKK